MNTTELIEIARECGGRYAYTNCRYHPFTLTELQQFAQRIEQPLLELVDQLNKKIDWQIEAISAQQAQIAEYAVLTEENEKLIEVIRQRSHKIAELEKDCEILQTNYDAALMQVKQLREALQGFMWIIADSKGVAGYHLNGAIAEWGEFDEVDAATKVLEETK